MSSQGECKKDSLWLTSLDLHLELRSSQPEYATSLVLLSAMFQMIYLKRCGCASSASTHHETRKTAVLGDLWLSTITLSIFLQLRPIPTLALPVPRIAMPEVVAASSAPMPSFGDVVPVMRPTKGAPPLPRTASVDMYRLLRHKATGRDRMPLGLRLPRFGPGASGGGRPPKAGAGCRPAHSKHSAPQRAAVSALLRLSDHHHALQT